MPQIVESAPTAVGANADAGLSTAPARQLCLPKPGPMNPAPRVVPSGLVQILLLSLIRSPSSCWSPVPSLQRSAKSSTLRSLR